MDFENTLNIGTGFYTPSEISHILRIPYSKVHHWMTKFWDGQLGKEYGTQYSWKTKNSKAVSFHTLVEFYVMMQLSEAGVKPKEVLQAHKELSKNYETAFPFAEKSLLDNISTDGRKIFLTLHGNTLTLDGTKQFNLALIKTFFKNLDFNTNDVASRLWPLGKLNSILIDPQRKFGHPIINGQNIYPETIHGMYLAGEPVNYIAYLYELETKEVMDAIEYCEAA